MICYIYSCALLIKNVPAHVFLFFLSSCADQVLEKAMHKCVLKPLKSVIEATLHDFQVRKRAIIKLCLYYESNTRQKDAMYIIHV